MWQSVVAIAGLLVAGWAGFLMTTIESQAGGTVAEAFYNQMGWLGIGLGVMLFVVCVSLAEIIRQNYKVIDMLRVQGAGNPNSAAPVGAEPSLPPL